MKPIKVYSMYFEDGVLKDCLDYEEQIPYYEDAMRELKKLEGGKDGS